MSLKSRKQKLMSICMATLIATGAAYSTTPVFAASNSGTARQMENLDRGLIATKVDNGVFLSWRMLGTDDPNISFHIYRNGRRITTDTISSSTNYLDTGGTANSTYSIRPVVNGKVGDFSSSVKTSSTPYLSVPIQKPADGTTPSGESYSYSANDGSVGDVDGDGQYEIILKWDPSNSKDNSQSGYTGNTYLDAYKLDGTRLWRIDLGVNIRSGAHYLPFIVYDLDGDGKAEVACRTADGTKDGVGNYIGDNSKDYRSSKGYILSGPEYLTVFEGATGKALSTIDFSPARGKVSDWGDSYGNRVDRFLGCVAYLDGKTPSLVMSRGYYVKSALTAYDFKNGKLTQRWAFTADGSNNSSYRGRGCHSLAVADVDNDNKDEIIYGSATIDDNGTGLYTTSYSHGDALHVGDLDPTHDGLEVFQVHEDKKGKANGTFRDAKTGNTIYTIYEGSMDCGRGLSADIDPRYPGEEQWGTGIGMYSAQGTKIGTSRPSVNFAAWWDGDLSRELVDGNKIDKWDYQNQKSNRLLTATGCSSNNSTKATPVLQADILGDWREEIIWRTDDSSALRIYSTTDLTEHKIYTLMHDPVYRESIAWQNAGYNQPPHTGFFLGNDMESAPTPNIYLAGTNISSNNNNTNTETTDKNDTTTTTVIPGSTKILSDGWYYIKNVNAQKYLQVTSNTAKPAQNVELGSGTGVAGQKWYLKNLGDGYITLQSGLGDYMLDIAYGKNEDGANLQIYGAYSGTAQQFLLKSTSVSNGYIIGTKTSGLTKALDAYNFGTTDGTNVCQWSYGGRNNQIWIFEPTSNNGSSSSNTTTNTNNNTETGTTTASRELQIQAYNTNLDASSNTIAMSLKIKNTSSSSIDLSKVNLHYYYTNEDNKDKNFWCDWSSVNSSNVTGSFVKMSKTTSTADHYFNLGFTSGAGTLASGAEAIVQIRISNTDWSNLTQSNDYSFNSSATSLVNSDKITAYINNNLASGVEP